MTHERTQMDARTGGHTPGPWRAVGTENAWQVVGEANVLVAEMPLGWGDDNTDPFVEADARLIAAAPDLLTACRDWIEYLDTGAEDGDWDSEQAMLDAMRAAIARATERTNNDD